MGQKVNPISNRLGYIRGWDSIWFESKPKLFAEKVIEDYKIRKYLRLRLAKASLSTIKIERSQKSIELTLHTARPGAIIGKGGQEIEKLREELKKLTNKEVSIDIFEIKRPELDAYLVATNIAKQIEGRISYKRAIKTAIDAAMRNGAVGIKIEISGRINGVEMARTETYKDGRIPLNTFRAKIDYAKAEALTKAGLLGIKVWICLGEVFGKVDLFESAKAKGAKFKTSYKK